MEQNLEKATVELQKYKKKEAEETAWIGPVLAALNAGLSEEIKAGTAEVASAGNAVIVNIGEQVLYTPNSVTFAKDSPQFRDKLAALLAGPEMKGKQISIANTTDAVQAQGKGRKRTPPRDARSLAADRSVALAKNLEHNKVDPNVLVAAAYSSKMPDTGFKTEGPQDRYHHRQRSRTRSGPRSSAAEAGCASARFKAFRDSAAFRSGSPAGRETSRHEAGGA